MIYVIINWLSFNTVHSVYSLAFTALQNVIADLPEWREDVISCFINFILKEVYDTFPLILESALKMMLQLLTQWKTTVQSKEDKVSVRHVFCISCSTGTSDGGLET